MRPANKHSISVILVTCLAGPLTVFAAELKDAERTNVVFILSDDQGYDSLSCVGAPNAKTPNLDRMAAEGVRVTQCYTAGPVCSPTRAALMTGNYQQRISRDFDWVVGGLGASNGLPPSTVTLPGMLKKNGYVTGIMGKWHLGGVPRQWPTRFGFDEFKGFVGGNLDYWAHDDIAHKPDLWDADKPLKADGYLTDLITHWSTDFIRRHKDRPFFLYVAYNAVHWPYQGPAKDERNVNRSPEGDPHKWCVGGGSPRIYRSMLERMDGGVGEILAALDDCQLTGRTLVIFSSDNGGDRPFASNKPLRGFKQELYDGGIRVPCIFREPGRIRAHAVCDQPIITMDLTATVLAATGTARDPRALPPDGMNVLPIINGTAPAQPRRFYWRAQPPGAAAPLWRAVRDGDWKLVQIADQKHLYNLGSDPSEGNDLANKEAGKADQLARSHVEWEAKLAPQKSGDSSKKGVGY